MVLWMLLVFWICLFSVGHCQKGKDLVQTPNEYLYKDLTDLDLSIDLLQSVVFYVRACNDAHIGLFKSRPSPKINSFYEIVIGGWGNTKSVIRDRRQRKPKVEHNGNMLNCNVYRQFWISWQGQRLKVGQGNELYKKTFMELNMRFNYDVRYVAITTGFGSEGNWIFEAGDFVCQNISCDSNQFRRKVCPVENAISIRSVTVVNRRSMSECQLGQSFGTTGNGSIFVDNGCRASFHVCFLVATEEETVSPTVTTVDQGESTTNQVPSTAPQVATVDEVFTDKQTIIPVVVVITVVIIIVVVVTMVTRYHRNSNKNILKNNFKPDIDGYDVINTGNERHSYAPLAISGQKISNGSVNQMESMDIYDEIEIKKSNNIFSFRQLKNPFGINNHAKNKTGSVVKPKPRFSIYDQDEYAVVK